MIKIKVLIGSAWPYAHNVPHLGNIIGSLLSGDVFARYYRRKGNDVSYVSGTDVHGTRSELEAEREGKTPRELSKENHEKIKNIIEDFNIKFDNYIWTESETHKNFVKKLYEKADENGYIITKTEKRAYCKNCSKFLADRYIEGTCPHCGSKNAQGNQCEDCGKLLEPKELEEPICAICEKNEITFKETKHWYLELGKLEPRLKELMRKKDWSKEVRNMTENMIKEGLRARAITRDLKWGIKAPFKDSEGKVIYVWAENALGYVSSSKEYLEENEWEGFWFDENSKHIYTMGKDNIPFHTIFFPAQLMSTEEGYHLPDDIYSTEFLNWIGGKSFSKSRDVGLYCDEALEILDAPYWRFYLLYNRPEGKDVEFSFDKMEEDINNVLIGKYGNFINRVFSLIEKYFNLEVPGEEVSEESYLKVRETKEKIENKLEKGKIRSALRELMNLADESNRYLQEKAPWKKEKDRKKVLTNCLYLAKSLGIMVHPFLPSISKKVASFFKKEEFNWKDLKSKEVGEVGEYEILLDKIDGKEVKKKYERIKEK